MSESPERDLSAELAAVRRRADRQYRRFLVAFLPTYFVVTVVLHLFDERGESIGDVVALGIVVAVLGVLFWVMFRKPRSWLPQQPLVAGLARQQRRSVRADLRRGRLNDDRLLAEVERLSVPRQRKAGRFFASTLFALVVLTSIAAVATTEGSGRATLYSCAAVLFFFVGCYQVVLNRRLRAFPL